MPHQCTHCGKVYPDAAEELLKGCSCGSRFFYYIRQEKLDELKGEVNQTIQELDKADKNQVEKDIRELTGLDKEPEKPVILDLESVRVIKPGKFEIDLVNLFAKNRPLIYKLEEGKYIIDLSSSMGGSNYVVDKKVFEEVEEEMTRPPAQSNENINIKQDKDSEQGVKEEVVQQSSKEQSPKDKIDVNNKNNIKQDKVGGGGVRKSEQVSESKSVEQVDD